MAKTYTIDQYQYSLSFEQGELVIKAINYTSLTDYYCKYSPDMITESKLIESLETLYDALNETLSACSDNNSASQNGRTHTDDHITVFSNDDSGLKINYDRVKDRIIIKYTIKFKYFNEVFDFELLKPKVIEDMALINNKLSYYNKRLTDYDKQIAKVSALEKTIAGLVEQVRELTFQTVDTRQILFYPGYHMIDIRTAIKLLVMSDRFIVNDIDYRFSNTVTTTDRQKSVSLRPAERVDYKYAEYLYLLNKLIYLEEINVDSQANLDMIKECKSVKKLTVQSCTDLTDISNVAEFDKMEEIVIYGCQSIKNLDILEECKSLKTVKLSSTMNTGVFTKDIQFVIQIV